MGIEKGIGLSEEGVEPAETQGCGVEKPLVLSSPRLLVSRGFR